MNKFKMAIAAFFCLALVACGGESFEGKYSAARGTQGLQFNANGTVTQFLLGKQVAEFKYEKDGKKITLHINDATSQVLEIQEDGNLKAPGNVIFQKEE